jgi:hypothetical protein
MGDHWVGVAGVTSHKDGVVGRQPGAGGLRRWDWMLSLLYKGGWAKYETETVRGTGEDAGAMKDAGNDVGATCGEDGDFGATRGSGGGARAVRDASGGVGAMRSTSGAW